MIRKKKFVIWLFNKTNQLDDEWVTVWAYSKKEAEQSEVNFDTFRFTRGHVLTAAEFWKDMGIRA